MSSQMKKELDVYFKQIKKLFPLYSKEEKRFLQDFKKAVYDFVSLSADCSFEDVIERFESPSDVVHNYISSIDQEYLFKKMSIVSLLKKILLTITIALILYFGMHYYYLYNLYIETQNQIITEEYTVIE